MVNNATAKLYVIYMRKTIHHQGKFRLSGPTYNVLNRDKNLLEAL